MTNAVRSAGSVSYRSNSKSIKIKCFTEGFSDETVIAFNENATEEYDNQFDANKFFLASGNGSMIYTKSTDEVLSINCMPELTTAKSVVLFTKVLANNDMTLSFEGLENISEAYRVLLEDTKMGQVWDVRNGNYVYSAELTDKEDRFVIHFINPQEVTSENNNKTSSIETEELNGVKMYSFNNSIYVNIENDDFANSKINVYDVQGKEITSGTLSMGLNIIEINNAHCVVIVNIQSSISKISEKFILN